jgi:hypothetical protein
MILVNNLTNRYTRPLFSGLFFVCNFVLFAMILGCLACVNKKRVLKIA